MRKFDLSLRSSGGSYFASFRHQLTILSKTDALDEEKLLIFFFTLFGDRFDLHSFPTRRSSALRGGRRGDGTGRRLDRRGAVADLGRSEEHTSELQSRPHLVCRLLLEKKKTCLLDQAHSLHNWRSHEVPPSVIRVIGE